jgi:predicted TIM-barrel fold metal-dependent hydrolase
MQYNIISADGHVDLRFMPGDVFTSRAPAKWKEQVPQIADTPEGPRWYAEGGDLMQRPFGNVANIVPPKRGVSKHVDRMYEVGFYDGADILNEGSPHPTTPHLRLKDQEIDSVDAEVMYGVLGMHRVLQSRELLTVVYQLYNDYVAELCQANPERLVALACIPNDDPQTAAAEVRRAASIGLKGADFVASNAVKPLWHRDWDPLWAAIQECGMPVSFHTAGPAIRQADDEAMAREYNDEYRATLLTMFQMCGAEFLASIIFSGALERHPEMKFVMGECGVGWLPYVLSRMDEEYEDQFRHMSLTMKPSEYWRRQGYTTFQHEPNIARFVDMVGEDNIMWGSDYPHPDGVWPDSHTIIQQDLGSLSAEARRKITRDNAGKLYGFL